MNIFKNIKINRHILLNSMSDAAYFVFVAVKVSVHTYIFPGHKSLAMLLYATAILVLSLMGRFFGIAHFRDPRGAFVAVLFLGVLYLVSRKDFK